MFPVIPLVTSLSPSGIGALDLTAPLAIAALLVVIAAWAAPLLLLWALGCLLEWLWPAPPADDQDKQNKTNKQNTNNRAVVAAGRQAPHARDEWLWPAPSSTAASTAALVGQTVGRSDPDQWPYGPSDTLMDILSANDAPTISRVSTLPTLPSMPTAPHPHAKTCQPASAHPLLDRIARRASQASEDAHGLPSERPSLPLYNTTHPDPDWPPKPQTPGAKTFRFVLASGELVRLQALDRYRPMPPSSATLN